MSAAFCISFFYWCAFENLPLNQDMPSSRTDKKFKILEYQDTLKFKISIYILEHTC